MSSKYTSPPALTRHGRFYVATGRPIRSEQPASSRVAQRCCWTSSVLYRPLIVSASALTLLDSSSRFWSYRFPRRLMDPLRQRAASFTISTVSMDLSPTLNNLIMLTATKSVEKCLRSRAESVRKTSDAGCVRRGMTDGCWIKGYLIVIGFAACRAKYDNRFFQ